MGHYNVYILSLRQNVHDTTGKSEERDGVGLSASNLLQNIPMLYDTVPSELEVVSDSEGDFGLLHPVVHDSVSLTAENGEMVGYDIPRGEAVRKELDGEIAALFGERVVLLVLAVRIQLVSPCIL